ncbi:MAG: DNA polymerase, partial [Candidatus Hydrogenedentota bacterium]
ILLEYREVAKLLNTYVEELPQLIKAKTGRLHTNFSQARTATGRLASINPNLQNIPVRSDRGRTIRAAFTAPSGRALVAADYAQIEFRIAAHFSGDETLLRAFREGLDLHAVTAERLFGDAKDPTARRKAKTVNFGILYGQSAFGLARQLGISRKEAGEMIEGYFSAFPKLRAWMDGVIEKARDTGYVETLFGRRRVIEEIKSRNHNLRAAGERIAVNTPVQGTAAEIIKLAMVRAHQCLSKLDRTGIVLQVHDELVVETDASSVAETTETLKNCMMNISPLEELLEVHTGSGADWLEAGH